MHLSSEDAASILVVLGTLEAQAAKLGPISKVAAIWRDWVDLLRPTAEQCDGKSGVVEDRALVLAVERVTPPSRSS